jgi:hypothetical protein
MNKWYDVLKETM